MIRDGSLTTNLDHGRLGFVTSYGVDGGLSAQVKVGIGYGRTLPDADYQTVELDDPRLPFTARAEFSDGLVLVHLFLSRRPGGQGISQGDLRRSGLVPVLRRWARVGRRFQAGELDDDLRGLVDLPSEDDLESALKATEESSLLRKVVGEPAPLGRRRSSAEAEATLIRVVDRYKELVALGDRAPRATIAAEENYHEAHIGRLLTQARRRTPPLLGPAAPGKAGELKEEPS